VHVLYKLTSCHEFHGDYGHVHDTSTSCHKFGGGYSHDRALSIPRHDLQWSFVMMIAFCPTISIRLTGLYLVCWMSSHEERF
jgi:hypothetical protein